MFFAKQMKEIAEMARYEALEGMHYSSVMDKIEKLIPEAAEQGKMDIELSIKDMQYLSKQQTERIFKELKDNGYKVSERYGDIYEPGITGYKISWE